MNVSVCIYPQRCLCFIVYAHCAARCGWHKCGMKCHVQGSTAAGLDPWLAHRCSSDQKQEADWLHQRSACKYQGLQPV